jgi:hypothetical protein
MPKYRVKTPIRHDGEDFGPGDTIELTQRQAEAIGADTLEPINEPKGTDDLTKLTKVDLVAFAAKQFGLQLDPASTKDDMLAAIAAKKAQ